MSTWSWVFQPVTVLWRLIINLPPRHLKSHLASIAFPQLYQCPRLEQFHVNAGEACLGRNRAEDRFSRHADMNLREKSPRCRFTAT